MTAELAQAQDENKHGRMTAAAVSQHYVARTFQYALLHDGPLTKVPVDLDLRLLLDMVVELAHVSAISIWK